MIIAIHLTEKNESIAENLNRELFQRETLTLTIHHYLDNSQSFLLSLSAEH